MSEGLWSGENNKLLGEQFQAALQAHGEEKGGFMVGDVITFAGRSVRITEVTHDGHLHFDLEDGGRE